MRCIQSSSSALESLELLSAGAVKPWLVADLEMCQL